MGWLLFNQRNQITSFNRGSSFFWLLVIALSNHELIFLLLKRCAYKFHEEITIFLDVTKLYDREWTCWRLHHDFVGFLCSYFFDKRFLMQLICVYLGEVHHVYLIYICVYEYIQIYNEKPSNHQIYLTRCNMKVTSLENR